jgi:hypothetical protein
MSCPPELTLKPQSAEKHFTAKSAKTAENKASLHGFSSAFSGNGV